MKKAWKMILILCIYSVSSCYGFKIVGDRLFHEEHKYSLLILTDNEWEVTLGEKDIDIFFGNKFTAGSISVISKKKNNNEKITGSDLQTIIDEFQGRKIIEEAKITPVEIKGLKGFKALCDGPSKGEIVILQNDNLVYLFVYLTDPFSYTDERNDFRDLLEGFEVIN